MEAIIQDFLKKMLELNINNGLSNFLTKGFDYFKEFFMEFTQEQIENLDELIFQNKNLRKGFKVERKGDTRTLETHFGQLTFQRRYYSDSKGYKYLIDCVLGIDQYERLEKSLCADICTKATDTSYAKSSQDACDGNVSKQTVMNLVRKVNENPIVFKETRDFVKEIHLQCDEDHVSMQTGNNSIVKLVVIHEPVETIGNTKRKFLPNKYAITSYSNETNEAYWYRIIDKINEIYGIRDEDNKLKVYIHGDGALWIKAGKEYVTNSYFILDKFHFKKAIAKVSGHNENYISMMREAVKSNDISRVKDMVEIFVNSEICTEDTGNNFIRYYLNNLDGIKIWKKLGTIKSSSCAEGLVSHMLSDRLSSRPKGWSHEGLYAISRLRTHVLNGGEITAKDFSSPTKSLESPLINVTEIRQNKQKNYDFAPLVTSACARTKRDALYRFLTSVTEGGYKF